jgi:hypothetical protein
MKITLPGKKKKALFSEEYGSFFKNWRLIYRHWDSVYGNSALPEQKSEHAPLLRN